MDERYKELLIRFYEKIKEVYDNAVLPFYHYFGKDKVDLQYNIEMTGTISHLIGWDDIGVVFPELLSGEESMAKFMNLSDANKEVVTNVLESMVEESEDCYHYRYVQTLADRLGMRYADILVYFPEIRVTNENDKYVDIRDLYAKVTIDCTGKLISNFTLNRTTYPMKQLMSDYLHSHVMGIGSSLEELKTFKVPCLGRGPIRETCNQLMTHKCGNIEWELFCLELDRYVHTESREGVPYKYLENIGNRSNEDSDINVVHTNFCYTARTLTAEDIKNFTDYLIESRKLKFNYVNGSYSLGMSTLQYMVMVSNLFIEWYNKSLKEGIPLSSKESLFSKNILIRAIVVNGRVYRDSNGSNIETYKSLVGEPILKFKGKIIPFRVIDLDSGEENGFVMLNPRLAISSLNVILKVLNFRYGREKANGGPESDRDNVLKTNVEYI